MPDRPLRILQVMRAPIGGLFRHVADLSHELAKRGHEIGIVVDSQRADMATEGKLEALAPHARLGIHRLPIPRVLGVSDLSTPLKVRSLARRLEIDVLHGHGAKGGAHARLARSGKTVALYTPHGGVLHFDPRSAAGRIFRIIERALLGRTDAMIFESAFAQRAFAEQIVVPTGPAPVIHNGLAPTEFEPVPLASDARDFVFVGELRELKGVRYLLEALVEVTALDGRPATLILAGDGPDRATFAELIGTLGLGERVTPVGVQPARRMFALGRCLVVPSLAELLPYVVLEGAAAGRPVIATRVGGIAEIFGPTAHSLIPPADLGALRAKMRTVLRDPAAADAEMRIRLEHVRTGFSVTHMTDQIEALYRALIGRR